MEEMTLYDRIGGEPTVRRITARFYALMDSLPQARTIRAMHPLDLATSEERLALFLIGWLGGPPVYVEQRGHPRLRARHLPFAIDTEAAQAWMACMQQALDEIVTDSEARAQMLVVLAHLAGHMRNTADPG